MLIHRGVLITPKKRCFPAELRKDRSKAENRGVMMLMHGHQGSFALRRSCQVKQKGNKYSLFLSGAKSVKTLET